MTARAYPPRASRARFLAPAAPRGPAPLALAVYGALTAVTLGVAYVRDESPLATAAAFDLPGSARHALSVVGGVLLAAATVGATRAFVAKWGWAKMLHADLRPAVRDAGDGTVLVLGMASGIAEELFFRGLLVPVLGLALSSLAFGALHRLRGRAGVFWMIWAGVMGLLFGGLFVMTGSLIGPIVAHAAINVLNLRFLRDTDVEPKSTPRLGGLLG